MRLLDHLAPLYNALVALNPDAPKGVFIAIVFSLVLLSRKLFPEAWKAYSGVAARVLGITEADTNWFKELLLKGVQALPSWLVGAVVAGLGTANFWVSLKLSLLAFLAPLAHEFMAHYKGKLGPGKDSTPPWDDQKPVGAKDPEPTRIFFANPRDPEEPPPAAAIRKWRHSAWRFALPVMLLVNACTPAALQAQRDAHQVVADASMKTVLPSLRAAYRASGLVVIRAQNTEETRLAALQLHQLRWKPVWEAWDAYKFAMDTWQHAINTNGNPLPAALVARDAYCKLVPLAEEWKIELPSLPLGACEGGK